MNKLILHYKDLDVLKWEKTFKIPRKKIDFSILYTINDYLKEYLEKNTNSLDFSGLILIIYCAQICYQKITSKINKKHKNWKDNHFNRIAKL